MKPIEYTDKDRLPKHPPSGYILDPTNPLRFIWKYPVCKFRKLKERKCCHGLKQTIQFCMEFKTRVIDECATCKRREF